MGAEVEADPLGDEWKGYILRISGGNDKQGFPMKQGVLTNGTSVVQFTYQQLFLPDVIVDCFLPVFFCLIFAVRVRLLLSKGHSCYRPRRDGERKRKSVRGCIVDGNLSVLSLVIVRKGEQVSGFLLQRLTTCFLLLSLNLNSEFTPILGLNSKFTLRFNADFAFKF